MTMDLDELPVGMKPEVDHTIDLEDMRQEESLASEDEFEEAQMIGDTDTVGFIAVDTIIARKTIR